jgi:F0F1-type ATP synthase membrane subunit a
MEAHAWPHILSIPPHAFAETGLLSYVTNTVFSTWIFILIVAVCASILFSAHQHKWGFVRTTGFLIVKYLKAFFEPLLGHNLPLNKTLWFVGGVFIYIFGANLYSLFLDWILAFLPGLHDYLRPINADINTTLGMALVMIIISHWIMIRFRGFFGYVGHFVFHFQGKNFVEKCINVIVGWLHGVGEIVRVLALSLRLFGNIFAGVVLIGVMIWLTWLIKVGFVPIGQLGVIPFYFLEMFVWFIQAMVFSLLVSMYFAEASEHEAH